jgi:SAM-dependent methyltransferase
VGEGYTPAWTPDVTAFMARRRAEWHAPPLLPLPDASVDAAFSHALLEHLPEPAQALREMRRVVRPGGPVVAVVPDRGSFILAPPDAGAEEGLARYRRIQEAAGGHPLAGRRLGEWMTAAGPERVALSARYEVYGDRALIAGYLAARLERDGLAAEARALRAWSARPAGMLAQAWVAAVGWG